MQLGIESHIPDGLLAANALLAENSRLGVATSTQALYQGFSFAISSTVLGLQFGWSGIVSGTVDAPNNGVLHSIVCGASSGLVNAAGPQNLNSTIGVGVGGSAGVGFILGIAASAGVQVVADSSGNLGVAFNFGGNPGYGVFGAGATPLGSWRPRSWGLYPRHDWRCHGCGDRVHFC